VTAAAVDAALDMDILLDTLLDDGAELNERATAVDNAADIVDVDEEVCSCC
jgi:hypothetical protein